MTSLGGTGCAVEYNRSYHQGTGCIDCITTNDCATLCMKFLKRCWGK